MWNYGKKIALCATIKINILTLVLSEIFFMNETKNHNPPSPFKLNGWSLRALNWIEQSSNGLFDWLKQIVQPIKKPVRTLNFHVYGVCQGCKGDFFQKQT